MRFVTNIGQMKAMFQRIKNEEWSESNELGE